MPALDVNDSHLQSETERQNRIHQNLLEQRKMQARVGRTYMDDGHAQEEPKDAPIDPQEWIDKIHAIPEMRSALIHLDEDAHAEKWSKPFSLAKADMEPWLSFYKGYKQSRLFIEASATKESEGDGGACREPDFAVRALLQLKQADARIIFEPPVRINRQVVYFDVEGELETSRDPARLKALLRSAAKVHDAELRKAVERGREMGNLLYDALMGEGHAHLINAWIEVFDRKPNIQELHLMLTTGRVKVLEQKTPAAAPKPRKVEEREPVVQAVAPAAPAEPVVPKFPPVRIDAAALAKLVADSAPDDETLFLPEQDNLLKVVWNLLLAAACCGAIAGIVFLI